MFAGCLTSFLLNMLFFCYTVYSSIREAEKGGGIHMAELPNQYTLMHKDIPVAGIMVDSASGAVISIGTVYEQSHVPVGIPVKNGEVDRRAFNQWWRGRAIPASRMGIQEALARLQIPDTQLLVEKSFALSLSDQYWVCPEGRNLTWGQVNFFENPFSEDMGNILFGKNSRGRHISLLSPDNTSDGWLRKKWVIIDGARCLVKGGSGAIRQEPYNEVAACRIMERLQIPHVPYTLLMEDDYPYSVCEDFITPDTELISAWHIMQTEKKPNHVSVYRHYLDCCQRLGIPGIEASLDRMLVLDYLIVNEDRHQNNFGVVRRADTLEYLGAAPIYDSGTSLWFDKPAGFIRAGGKTAAKPFKSSHEEQIKLVRDFSWLDFSALEGIDEELREIVRGSLFIDQVRCDALARGLKGRVEMLEKAVLSAGKSFYVDSIQGDLKEDRAYSAREE